MAQYTFIQRQNDLRGNFLVAAGNGMIVLLDTLGQGEYVEFDRNNLMVCHTSSNEAVSFERVIVDQSGSRSARRFSYFGFSAGFFRIIVRNFGSENLRVQYEVFKSADGINWSTSFFNENGYTELILIDGVIVRNGRFGASISFDEGLTFSEMNDVPYLISSPFAYEVVGRDWAVTYGGVALDKRTGKISLTYAWDWGGGFYNSKDNEIITNNLSVYRGASEEDFHYNDYIVEFSRLTQAGESTHCLQVIGDWSGNYALVRSSRGEIEVVAGVAITFGTDDDGFEFFEADFVGGIEPHPDFGPVISQSCYDIFSVCLGADRHLICMSDPYDEGIGRIRFVLAEPVAETDTLFIPFWTNRVGAYEQQS